MVWHFSDADLVALPSIVLPLSDSSGLQKSRVAYVIPTVDGFSMIVSLYNFGGSLGSGPLYIRTYVGLVG